MKILSRFHQLWHAKKVISDSRIQIQYDVEQPVDLGELTLAFAALNRQYQKFVSEFVRDKGIEIPNEDSIRLFVTKIESNCIIAELGWVDPGALFVGTIMMMDNYNTMKEFLKNTWIWIDYFRGQPAAAETKQLCKRDCEDYRDVLTPAVQGGGLLRFKQLKYDAKGNARTVTEMEYGSSEVIKALSGAKKKIEEFEATNAADYPKVLMYLASVDKKMGKPESKRTHDSGIVESISKKALRVLWLSDMDQAQVKNYDGNPLKCSFLVDVNVETVHGEPRALRIVRLHEIIPGDEEPGTSEGLTQISSKSL